MSSEPTLQVHKVSKGYLRGSFVEVLRDISLEVGSGEVVAVIGRRLGGKSTLLQIAAGLEEPDEGTITLAGRPVRVQRRRSFREWWAARRTGSTDPVLGHDMVLVTRDGPHQELEVGKYVGGPLAVRGSRRRDVAALSGHAQQRLRHRERRERASRRRVSASTSRLLLRESAAGRFPSLPLRPSIRVGAFR